MIEQLDSLDRSITLWLNGSHSLFLDNIILVATSTWVWIPIGIYIIYIVYHNLSLRDFGIVMLMFFLCIFISDQVSSSIVKPLVHRWRPTQDPSYMYFIDVVNNYRGGRFGFYSAHASNTFTVAIFFSRLFGNKLIRILMISWAILNCYTRVYLGVHYFGDLLVGTCFGLLWGNILYYVYEKWMMSRFAIASSDDHSVSRFNIEDLKSLSVCIFATYCCIFIIALFNVSLLQ